MHDFFFKLDSHQSYKRCFFFSYEWYGICNSSQQFSTSVGCMYGYPYLLLLLAIKAIIIYSLSDSTDIDKR